MEDKASMLEALIHSLSAQGAGQMKEREHRAEKK